MYKGYIKSWRKTLESQTYKALNASQRDIFWVCLLSANHIPKTWEWKKEIFTCTEGQFITSLDGIKKLCAKDTTIQNIRTALLKLEKWQFLTNESTKAGRLITITNWDTYQSLQNGTNKANDKELTKHQQSTNKALTSNKKEKKEKKEKNPPTPLVENPDWLDQKVWQDFKDYRKQLKSKMTERAEELAILKLDRLKKAGNDPVAVIEQSIMQGWKGLFELKEQKQGADDDRFKKAFGKDI